MAHGGSRSERVRRRRASGLSVLQREAVRRGRHVSPDRARSLRGTSEVTNLASSGRWRASQRASGPGAPDSRCSTGDPDDLLVRRAAVRIKSKSHRRDGGWQRPRCCQGRWLGALHVRQRAWHVCLSWQMADATMLSGQMAEGRAHVAQQTERAGAAAKGVWVVGAAARSRAQGPTRLA